jgi:hypothetical protein
MPSHIAYYIHGRGRGHASRSLPVAQRLGAEGYAITVHSGGDAEDLRGAASNWQSRPPLMPGFGAVRLPLRVAGDLGQLGRERPDLVVSDGDQPVLIAARARRLPALALGHDLVFTCCDLPPGLPRASLCYEWANAAVPTYFVQHRVAVHFLPVEPTRPGTRVARPDGEVIPTVERGEHFVAYFRDANGGPIVGWMRALGCDVRWFGPGATAPDGSCVPFASREKFQHELLTAAGVVGSAGSNLVAECVLHGKPLLAVHRCDDTEQELNAALAAAANVALAAAIEHSTRAVAARFVDRVRAGDFARVPIAEQMRPVSDVMSELVGLSGDVGQS